MHRALAFLVAAGIAACVPPAMPARPVEPGDLVAPAPEPRVRWERVASLDAVPRGAPPAGTWRIHLIDVGTGLALLVQGSDFAMLYDAGSNDRQERPSRVLDYLAAALDGATAIDHVVLSHPHYDHASALEEVLDAYEVANIWDDGAVNDAVFYRDLLAAIAREPGAVYHTAMSFSEGDVVELGEGAHFTILHAEAKRVKDLNAASIVLAVDLGATRLLLTGDAGSGKRADPSAPVGETEEYLMDHAGALLDADILQVGHHGSKTSSRRAFLDAVSPSLALVSTGPKAYSGTVLPDREVIDALAATGATILRTDEHDASCPDGPGGCDSYVITIEGTPPPPR